jgi:hypothetical protein
MRSDGRVADAPIDPEYVEAFRRDGFVVVPALLADDELTRFGAAVDAAVATRTAWDRRRLAIRTGPSIVAGSRRGRRSRAS